MKITTHYDSLGVSRNAPVEVIRAAYKALAQKNHPDKNLGNPDSTNIMQTINQAYDVLSDPGKREIYDLWLGEQERQPQAPVPSPSKPARTATRPASSPPPSGQPVKRTKSIFFLLQPIAALGFVFYIYTSYNHAPPHRAVPAAVTSPPVLPPVAHKSAQSFVAKTTTSQELATCIFTAAQTYSVSPAMLLGILSAEGGSVGQKTLKPGNAYDLGLLQINSLWISQLAPFWGVNEDTAFHMVRDDACINVGVGAWILRATLDKSESPQEEISLYHASAHHLTKKVNDAEYVNKVIKLMDVYKSIHSPEDLLDQAPISVDR